MKKKLILFAIFIGIVALLIAAGTIFVKNTSFSWWSAQISGVKTIQSSAYQVEASGLDLRVYSFVDSHGRLCTTGFASNSSIGLDCDYTREIK